MAGSIKDAIVTIYKDVYSVGEPNYITLGTALGRIMAGKSRDKVDAVRAAKTKDEASAAKKTLPAVCFSGKIGKVREDSQMLEHSGIVTLDFDNLDDVGMTEKFTMLTENKSAVAVFVSPSGKGVKALFRIADPKQHRKHYEALLNEIPDLDKSNINETRVCWESYDPSMYINYNAVPYTRIYENEKFYVDNVCEDTILIFRKIERWLEKKSEAFVSGNRNFYLFKLAGACCRFGISEDEAKSLIKANYLSKDSEFTVREVDDVVKSAYRRNLFDSAEFKDEQLVERGTTKEIKIDLDNPLVNDVIYGGDCYESALNIYNNGYESAESSGIKEVDALFKWKRGELTVLTGIGNHGKSTFLNFLMLNKSMKDGSKWAIFSPENNPAQEYYHDLVETYLGANCTPENSARPSVDTYREAYEWVSKHFFYVFPKDLLPTPEYIKSRFLELIIKEKIDGCVIDPFNQMSNDYKITGGRDDKYLETFLADCSRFAISSNVFFVVVAHPHKLKKEQDGSYNCPDVYDLSGGAMWNNKADNILVYHRPNRHKDPTDRVCEFHSKKIRRQKIVGSLGMIDFEYVRGTRRFEFNFYPLKYVNNTSGRTVQTEADLELPPF